MKKRIGLQAILTLTLCTSMLLPSSTALSQMIPANPISALGGMLGGKATQAEQFAQIALDKEQLEYLLQSVEALQLGDELTEIFEQMFGVQTIVEDVLDYEVPAELVEKHDLINPLEHKRLTEERNQYLEEIDAKIAGLEKEIALNPDQMDTLTRASEKIEDPRSDIVATQAQFLADQAALEQDRRAMAIELLKAKRREIREQVIIAQMSSKDAALKCIRTKVSVDEC